MAYLKTLSGKHIKHSAGQQNAKIPRFPKADYANDDLNGGTLTSEHSKGKRSLTATPDFDPCPFGP